MAANSLSVETLEQSCDVFDIAQIKPIKLSAEEQKKLVIEYKHLSHEYDLLRNRNILTCDKLSTIQKKWFQSLSDEDKIRLIDYADYSKEDFDNMMSYLSYTRDSIFQKLWASIIKYVFKIFNKYYQAYMFDPKKRSDLLYSAMTAVTEVLPKYDEEKGALSNFLTPYITHAGFSYASRDNNMTDRNNLCRKQIMLAIETIKKAGREPDIHLIHELTDVPIKTIKEILENDTYKENNISIDALDRGSETYSDDDRADVGLKSFESPEDIIEGHERTMTINRIISTTLDNKSKKIIQLKIGYVGGHNYTDNEISQKLNIPVGEVISRYNAAIRTLRKELSQDPLFNNQSIKEKKESYDQILHFVPAEISKEDSEDAFAFMESVNFRATF